MSYLNFKNMFDFEKKSVFLINFSLIVLVIIFLLFSLNMKYFFYFDILITFILSFLFFKHSKKLSKTIIITNLFIFFYFLYPSIAEFLTELIGVQSYMFILFYNILIAYIFLTFSGYNTSFFGNIKKINFKLILVVLIIGFTFGLLFTLIKEPIPSVFTNSDIQIYELVKYLLFSSFIVAFSEQIIFSGFLFNTYKKLTTKFDAIVQVSIVFVMFHLLRFKVLVEHYFTNFNDLYLFYISGYYILLFLFMITALYLYSFKSRKYEGNFIYPVILHFAADFSLFLFSYLAIN